MSNPTGSPNALRQSLETALVDAPDDQATHAAYADWLTEQDDPLLRAKGEFIAVQLALDGVDLPDAERKRLQRRQRKLLKTHQREWLGGLAVYLLNNRRDDLEALDGELTVEGDSRGTFAFGRGWLRDLEIEDLTCELARVVAQSPELQLLRRLGIGFISYQEEAFADLVPSPYLSNLRSFQLGLELEACHTGSHGVVDFIATLPRLEELTLLAHGVDLDRLFSLGTLTCLRRLQVYHVADYHPLTELARNPTLKQLTHLSLRPHNPEPGDEEGYIDSADCADVFYSEKLPNLTHLQLHLTGIEDQDCQEIIDSGILRRLRVLDLGWSRITDEGARVLAGCADLRHLERLDLSRNRLTKAGIAALRATGIEVRADNQQEPRKGKYSNEYLFERDCE